ncbi:flagellar biosynthesis protein FlhF [Idiomarina sp. HP20-50]|uniref:flagellar biosynthesis protein FlhF n=1 Tax=Idiomarina sp. HP20-50 TaxID=3070813 RepID=UPI00294B0FDF|nr:flagellar biosynthesis protein FlhF [Idiomarina sp. HP20-50]MDV6316948.1 flagellar biosynthesis protein FlhF [Idiomarina sp. HP20-50]
MKIKRFFAEDMRRGLQQVKETLGPDAIILSNKKVNGGIELVAAIDPDAQQAPSEAEQAVNNQPKSQTPEVPAESLQELLQRQVRAEQNTQNSAPEKRTQKTAQPEPQGFADTQLSDDIFPEQMNTPAADDSQAIAELRSQVNGIRQLLEHQLSGLMKQEMDREEPTRAMLMNRLMAMGLSERVADQIACFIPEGGSDDEAWEQTLHLLEGQLNTTSDDILTRGGAVALVGPTGVGKTTTIAKLAARYAQRHGADKVALITTDTFRIGASEQLQTYGRIIGCPVKVAKNAQELADALLALRQKSLILIDTAGMGQRDKRLNEQLSQLIQNSRLRIRPYLVLSATSQTQVLMDAVKQFKTLPLSGCIFTKLDECLSLGESISVAIEHGLPVGYLTNGQQVPEDIRVADANFMVAEAERLLDKSICSSVSDVPKSYWNTASSR